MLNHMIIHIIYIYIYIYVGARSGGTPSATVPATVGARISCAAAFSIRSGRLHPRPQDFSETSMPKKQHACFRDNQIT